MQRSQNYNFSERDFDFEYLLAICTLKNTSYFSDLDKRNELNEFYLFLSGIGGGNEELQKIITFGSMSAQVIHFLRNIPSNEGSKYFLKYMPIAWILATDFTSIDINPVNDIVDLSIIEFNKVINSPYTQSNLEIKNITIEAYFMCVQIIRALLGLLLNIANIGSFTKNKKLKDISSSGLELFYSKTIDTLVSSAKDGVIKIGFDPKDKKDLYYALYDEVKEALFEMCYPTHIYFGLFSLVDNKRKIAPMRIKKIIINNSRCDYGKAASYGNFEKAKNDMLAIIRASDESSICEIGDKLIDFPDDYTNFEEELLNEVTTQRSELEEREKTMLNKVIEQEEIKILNLLVPQNYKNTTNTLPNIVPKIIPKYNPTLTLTNLTGPSLYSEKTPSIAKDRELEMQMEKLIAQERDRKNKKQEKERERVKKLEREEIQRKTERKDKKREMSNKEPEQEEIEIIQPFIPQIVKSPNKNTTTTSITTSTLPADNISIYNNRTIEFVDNRKIIAILRQSKTKELLEKRNYNSILFEKKYQLSPKDVGTLGPNEWLNDSIFYAYFSLLKDYSKNKGLKNYYLDSYFYSTLTGSETYPTDVIVFPTKLKIDQVLESDRIIFPISLGKDVNSDGQSTGSHWVLGVINLKEKKIQYYDSLQNENPEFMQYMELFIEQLYIKNYDITFTPEEWKKEFNVGLGNKSKQEDSSSCGVFACIFAAYISVDKSLAEFSGNRDNMNQMRKLLLLDIINGTFTGFT